MVVGAVSDIVAGQLITAMDGLKNVLRESISFADNAQKASLALGQTYSQTKDTLAPAMEGLRGDLNEKFAAAIAGMEAGLQGNTAGISRLINQQRLTGTQSANTAQALAGLEAGLDLSRDQTNNLAESMIETGNQYGVSTDKLVQAVDALKSTFPAQALAGMGDKVMGAVTNLQAELGPQLAGPLNQVMKMVLDTSFEGQERLTKLNIGGVREQLSAAKDSTEAQAILAKAFETASETFVGVAGNVEENFLGLGAAGRILGEQSIAFTTIQQAMGDRVAQEGEQAIDFGNTLATIKSEVFVPLQETFAQFHPLLISVTALIGGAVRTGLEFLVTEGKRLFVELGGLRGIVATIREKFQQFRTTLQKLSTVLQVGVIAAFTILTVKVGILLFPFIKIAAIATLIWKAFQFLNDKFGIFNPLIDLVTIAFGKLKEGLGTLLISLGEIVGVPDILIDWGESLLGITKDVTKDAEKQKLTNEQINTKFDELIEADVRFAEESLGVQKNIAESTKIVADKATEEVKQKTNPFLDQTTLTLGRAIADVIGFDRDDTGQEILDAIREGNLILDAKGDGVGGVPFGTRSGE